MKGIRPMPKKKNNNITREEIMAVKTISLAKKRNITVVHQDHIMIRRNELKTEKYALTAFKKAKNNNDIPLRDAFEKEIRSFNNIQYYEIIKYIEKTLERLSIYNKKLYYLNQERRHFRTSMYCISDFKELFDYEVEQLFNFFIRKIEE